jgi:hypothetical protein
MKNILIIFILLLTLNVNGQIKQPIQNPEHDFTNINLAGEYLKLSAIQRKQSIYMSLFTNTVGTVMYFSGLNQNVYLPVLIVGNVFSFSLKISSLSKQYEAGKYLEKFND